MRQARRGRPPGFHGAYFTALLQSYLLKFLWQQGRQALADDMGAAHPAVTRRSERVENAENGIFSVDLLQSWRQYALRVVSSTF